MRYYILDDNNEPVPVPSYAQYHQWRSNNRALTQVALEYFEENVCLSTVFLGMDHSFSDESTPLLFESLIFDGPHDGEMRRTTTWAAAEVMHQEMIDRYNLRNTYTLKPPIPVEKEVRNIRLGRRAINRRKR